MNWIMERRGAMKITNNHDWPLPYLLEAANVWPDEEHVAKALKQYEEKGYIDAPFSLQKGRIGAWLVSQPIQQTLLRARYDGLLTEDCSAHGWRIRGTGVHMVTSRFPIPGWQMELPLKFKIGSWEIRMRLDCLDAGGTLTDYKDGSTWTITFMDEQKQFEYDAQVNIYALGCHRNDIKPEVKRGRVWLTMRDHMDSKVGQEGYPPTSGIEIPCELWPHGKTIRYIETQLMELELNWLKPDEELKPCTEAERWYKVKKFAIMKEGRKRAIKLFDSLDEAERWWEAQDDRDHLFLERRGEINDRCERYCVASSVCRQFAHLKRKEQVDEDYI
jgi:hypothetical protein